MSLKTPLAVYDALTVTTGAAAATTALPQGSTIVLKNLSATAAEIVWIRFGSNAGVAAAVAAGAGCVALLPGTIEAYGTAPQPSLSGTLANPSLGATHISMIAASGTPQVNIVTGEGA